MTYANNKDKYAVATASGEVFTYVMADSEESLDVVKTLYPTGTQFFDLEKYGEVSLHDTYDEDTDEFIKFEPELPEEPSAPAEE